MIRWTHLILFAAGLATGHATTVLAGAATQADAADGPRAYVVHAWEVRGKLATETFDNTHIDSFKLSDGSTRMIRMSPVEKDGRRYIDLNDQSSHGFATHTWIPVGGSSMERGLLLQVDELPQTP